MPVRSVHNDDQMNERKSTSRSLPFEDNRARGRVLPVPVTGIGSLHQALGSLMPTNQMISRLLGPFPPLPEELHEYQQALLETLEHALSEQNCVLVEISEDTYDGAELLWTCVDRLLQYTPIERILVLAGTATLKDRLSRTYEEWVSLEDDDRLVRYSPGQYELTVPLASTTRVCIASIREGQLMVPVQYDEDEPQGVPVRPVLERDTFDAIIIYGTPVLSSPLWQRVIPYFTVSHLICFGVPHVPSRGSETQ